VPAVRQKLHLSICSNLRVRLYLHLRQISTGRLPTTAEDPARPHAGKAAGNQDGVAAKNAPSYPVSGTLVEASRYRPLRILCRAHKQSGALSVPALRGRPLALHASAAQPERWLYVGPDDEAGRRLASRAAHPSPLARPALRRETLEVRAGCSNRACPDLCGGCSATGIPTAILGHSRHFCRVPEMSAHPLTAAELQASLDRCLGSISRHRTNGRDATATGQQRKSRLHNWPQARTWAKPTSLAARRNADTRRIPRLSRGQY